MSKEDVRELTALLGEIVRSFKSYANESSLTFLPTNRDVFAAFVETWLENGGGVRVCRQDYTTYLQGLIAIHDDLFRAHQTVDTHLGYGRDKWVLYTILDPRFFAECVRRARRR